jgi:F-type H+-transporting ATPase subunit delta
MNYSIISTRYAKALFLVGTDNQCLDALKADMELLAATVKNNPVFAQVLDNPVIKPPQKRKVMNELLDKKVHPATVNLVSTIIRNRRETMLPDIARSFIDLYHEHRGIKRAHITSAVDLDGQARERLQEQLNTLFKAEVQMETEVNPGLIGGFILRAGDQQYDASLSSALKRMKQALVY